MGNGVGKRLQLTIGRLQLGGALHYPLLQLRIEGANLLLRPFVFGNFLGEFHVWSLDRCRECPLVYQIECQDLVDMAESVVGIEIALVDGKYELAEDAENEGSL